MSDVMDDLIDYPAAYEALVEFLYLAPVGIIKFRPNGVVEMANPAAAQLIMPLTSDGDFSNIYTLFSTVLPDLRAHVEHFSEPAGQIFDQLQLTVPGLNITLMLDINKINDHTMMAAVQNITDLTHARRSVLKATENQRLLASIFMRLNLPVVVIRADGFIVLANNAFQHFSGYDSAGLLGLNIDALMQPDCANMARAARSQQQSDGRSYELEMSFIGRTGRRINAVINSCILKESDQKQLRVVTVVPNAANRGQFSDPDYPGGSMATRGRTNQVKSIDLSDIKAAIGPDWEYIASRAMDLSEAAIRQVLSATDIVKQGKDNSFIIWFANEDSDHNAAALAMAAQAVRRVFLVDFGSKVARRVAAQRV